jgi:hypothetical protein
MKRSNGVVEYWSDGMRNSSSHYSSAPFLQHSSRKSKPSWKTKLNRGFHVLPTDFDQRAVTRIHRGLISGYVAPRGGVCRERLT